jgi:hypothetical protein
MHLRFSVPNQPYEVYLYTVENHADYFRSMDLRIEDELVAHGLGNTIRGQWRRNGPYRARVSDESLDIEILNGGKGDPHVFGLEIFSGSPAKEFFLGVNLGGDAVTIGSRRWLSGDQALAAGMRIDGASFWITDISLTDLGVSVLHEQGVPRSRIVRVPYQEGVRSTRDEAAALCDYLDRRSLNRVILVTSPFHSRRTSETFQAALKAAGHQTEVRLAILPDSPESPDGWWLSRAAALGLATEYIKLAYYTLTPWL